MIKIAGRKIGPEYPPFMIADVGANHDGDLDRAYALIEMAAKAGADAVKFQNFSASKIVSRRGFEELGQVGHQASWGKSVYETYEDASIPLSWTNVLADRCKRAGVAYLTTPYDLEAVDAIDPYVPAWKIGSGDITYHELIRKVASKGRPVLLATGASTAVEVKRAMETIWRRYDSPIVLMQCNSDYGTPSLTHSNLRVLRNWGEEYDGYRLGLSDHTPGHLAVCAAVALGACVIEKHLTDDHARSGPDHSFAMEPQEWREMVEAARLTHSALGDGIKEVKANETEALIVQRRALRYKASAPSGMTVLPQDVIATRPCPEGALEPYRIDEVLGKTLKRDVEADTLVREEDFE